MDRDQLVMALASVFAGLTVLLVVLGFVYQPFLLLLALPFGATAYFMWYQASGRLDERTRRRVQQGYDRERHSGFGAGARRASTRENYRRATGGGTGRTRQPVNGQRGPSRTEAYRALGLDPDASAEEVKRAYRSKVKEAHPDTDTGSEEAFKRVNRAYETLTD